MKISTGLFSLILLAAFSAAAGPQHVIGQHASTPEISGWQEHGMSPLAIGSRCDWNHDGKVDVLDLYAGIQALLGASASLDLNCDGTFTILDLQLLVNVVLGGSCPAECALNVNRAPPLNLGQANLRIFFSPNPVADDGTGRFRASVFLSETNGVALTLTSLTVGSDTTNRIDQVLPDRRIEAGGSLTQSYIYAPQAPVAQAQNLLWEIRGNDELGHENLVWRSSIRLVPFSSARYGHLAVFFDADPVMPDDDGTAGSLLVVQETNDVGITLTSLTINGVDSSAQILEPRIPARTALGAIISFPYGITPGDYEYVFRGNDDNGHTGLIWSTTNHLREYIQLLSGVAQDHQTLRVSFTPFQFRIFVPQGSTTLTVRLEGPAAPENLLDLFIRAAAPLEISGNTIPSVLKADFQLADLGTGSVRIDASASPPLQTGTSYYCTVRRTSGSRALPYTISATVSR
jgi:hypothetical protein